LRGWSADVVGLRLWDRVPGLRRPNAVGGEGDRLLEVPDPRSHQPAVPSRGKEYRGVRRIHLSKPVWLERGPEPMGIWLLCDVTGRRQEQPAGERSERRLREIFENLAAAILVVRLDGRILMTNAEARRLLYLPEQAEGTHLQQWTDRARSLLEPVPRGRQRTLELRRRDGRRLLLGFSSATVSMSEGPAVIILCRDIRPLKEAEDRRRRAEQLAQVGEMASRLSHEIKNPLCSVMAGLQLMKQARSAEAAGPVAPVGGGGHVDPADPADPAHPAAPACLIAPVAVEGPTAPREDGGSAADVVGAAGRAGGAGAAEPTDTADTAHTAEPWDAAQKVTPGRQGCSGDDDPSIIDSLMGEVSKIDRAVRELLKQARPLALQPTRVSLSRLIYQALVSYMSLASTHRVLLELADNGLQGPGKEADLQVMADSVLLERLLSNLIINAVEACSGGGRVRLGARMADLQTRERVLGGFPHPVAVLEVADDGPGMTEELRAQVFDPFFTTKGEGTGLGLATVKEVVDIHGGHVELCSAPEQGTTFRIYLPAGECLACWEAVVCRARSEGASCPVYEEGCGSCCWARVRQACHAEGEGWLDDCLSCPVFRRNNLQIWVR
jgi:PAS domain S-box-containing protein